MADDPTLAIEVTLRGYRDTRGRFTRANEQAVNALVLAAELWKDRALDEAERLSPVGNRYPNTGKHRRQEKSGPVFKESWIAKFIREDSGGRILIENTSPQAVFLFEGTKPHPIFPKGDYPLAWQGPEGVFHYAPNGVMHPGTDPIDLPEKVSDMLQDDAEAGMRRVAERVKVEIVNLFN